MPAMWIAGGAALSAAGGVFGGMFASKGAKAQAAALRYQADVARQTALEIDRNARADLAPFRQYGITAGDSLMGLMTGQTDVNRVLSQDSLYKWQLQQGTRDINRQLTARGRYDSGAGLETLALFTQQLGADASQRYYDRLFNLTTMGENAAARMATNTVQTGNNLMNTQANLGIAQAGAIGQQYQSWGQAIGGTLSGLGGMMAQTPSYMASVNYLNSLSQQNASQQSAGGGGLGLTGFQGYGAGGQVTRMMPGIGPYQIYQPGM